MKKNNSLFALIAVSWALLILTVSIAVPLVIRPFYYAHIDALHLTDSGFSREEIVEAYDEMMDFCFFGGEFSTGVMKFSEDGKSHFEDVGRLFRLDFAVMIVSAVIVAVTWKKQKELRWRMHTCLYWGGMGLLLFFAVIAFIGSFDFSQTFIVFHKIFFPGKTNWWFDPGRDQIILVLPEIFFRNCAILIVGTLFALCGAAILGDRKK
ncbi:MAG: TIGR01906 family membrane protein [Erysipelotrichaceae bacterium]|nr:TIGR01906 family membrane protein [Erysipelotrichaceae bacterium]